MSDQTSCPFQLKLNSQISPQKIVQIIQEKQQIIQSLSQQITKYKAEQLKFKKQIKQLQDKVQKLSPSNNTTSNFMLPSQFKSFFEQFMTNSISNALGDFIQLPFMYNKLVSSTFIQIYSNINTGVKQKVKNILKILNLSQSKQISEELFQYLLPFFQNYYKQISFYKTSNIRFNNESQNISGLQYSEDFKQMIQQLEAISTYMVLQQKPWQFVFSQHQIIKFQKKQHVCIDGWLKQNQNAITVLKGLKKQNHFHPNLKNYVIPFSLESQISQKQQSENLRILFKSQIQNLKEDIQKQKQCFYINDNNNSTQIFGKKQKIEKLQEVQTGVLFINQHNEKARQNNGFRAQIKTQKSEAITSDNKGQVVFEFNRQRDNKNYSEQDKENQMSNKKINKTKNKDKCDKIGVVKKKKDRNISLIQNSNTNKKNKDFKNIFAQQSYDQVLGFNKNHKKWEDLPVSRQIKNNRKNTKLNSKTSRKGSVGKIINQFNQIMPTQKMIYSEVSTMLMKQNLIKNQNCKQKMYKEAVNMKLCQKLDKMIQKQKNTKKIERDAQHSQQIKSNKQQRCALKQDRVMKHRQDKPVRASLKIGILRQKYLN